MAFSMSPAAMRRIRREIEIIREKLPDYDVDLNEDDTFNNNNNINKNKYINVITPNHNLFVFAIPNDYPFKPPVSLTINGENYRFLLKNMPRRIQYLYDHPNDLYYQEGTKIAHFNKPSCLCCSTLLCGDNWTPVCTLYSVLNEVKGHNELKRQIIYKLSLKPIFDKYGLPADLLRYLFGFL
jgi:ubiquitin-protein ligase